jgi:uncharacterized membrane protein/protein-disulfide isomerase
MTPLSRKLLLAFAALGLAAASTSTYVHYKLMTDPSYTSFCDVSGHVNCTDAYLSRYGSLWGVPVAVGGVMFFALALALAGVGGRKGSVVRDAVPGYIFALSTVGLAFVLYLAWASYFQLKVFCILCAVTYVSVIGIFIVSGGATTVPMTTLPRRAGRDLRTLVTTPIALVIALLFVAGSGALVVLFPRESAASQASAPEYMPLTDKQRQDLEKWWAVQPKVDLPIPPAGEKVLVVKFSDYMCPACRQTYEQYKGVLGKYLSGGQVRYVVKHYPLEAECNPNAPSNHYASCEAAAAVIMARPKGTAEKLEQWIFTNQGTLTPASVRQAAKDIGGISDFDAQYQRALQEVKTDASLGGMLGVNSTPTFYINGRKLPNGQLAPPQYFDYLIELALKSAQ